MLPWPEIILRLVLAAIFGAAIGLERERKDWAAGLRTHMMVCMGSCLMMMVSSFGFQDVVGKGYAELDPSRVAAQIVSGIGFIGAGAILFLKPSTILGLTTASALWTVAGIGMATGGGMYFASGAATVLSIVILWGVQPLQRKFSPKFLNKTLSITAKSSINPKEVIDLFLSDTTLDYSNVTVSRQSKEIIIEIRLENIDERKLTTILEVLQTNSDMKKIAWTK